jgi:sigma-B regulation protein RsbU (phosphoserine phosphatase)
MPGRAARESTSKAVRVLVADDSRDMRRILEEMLLGFAYEVALAENGKEAVERYLEFKPHIILLDMHMPEMDGLEVIEHVRENLNDQDTMIIMLTSDETPELKIRAFGAGANDYLHKPFDRPELLARVAVAARQMRMHGSLRDALATIEQEMDLVASLQLKLLPSASPEVEGLRIRSLYEPSGLASGDYFDHFELADGSVRAVIADVSGHGARAAFIMSIVRTLFRMTQRRYMDLAETFSLINSHLTEIIGREEDFVTCMACDIDFAGRNLTYINAGHCPGMLKAESGEVERLGPTETVLGFFDVDYVATTVGLPEKSSLFMFTDGFYDWEVEPGRLLSLEAFWDLAAGLLGRSDFLEQLMDDLGGLSLNPCCFRDDLTALEVSMAAGLGSEYVFRFKASPDRARGAVKDAMDVLARYVQDENALYDFDLCLTEAGANAVKHAYPENKQGDVEIRMRVEKGEHIAVEVSDWGAPLKMDAEPVAPRPDAESGRGLYIISRLMDVFEVRRRISGKTLFFKKNIGADAWKA